MKILLRTTLCATMFLGVPQFAHSSDFLRLLLLQTVIQTTVHAGVHAAQNNRRNRNIRVQRRYYTPQTQLRQRVVVAPTTQAPVTRTYGTRREVHTTAPTYSTAPRITYSGDSVYDPVTYQRLVNGASAAAY